MTDTDSSFFNKLFNNMSKNGATLKEQIGIDIKDFMGFDIETFDQSELEDYLSSESLSSEQIKNIVILMNSNQDFEVNRMN